MVQEECTQQVQRIADGFRQLAESLGDVFWLADAKTARLLYISPGCEEIWGYTASEMRARPDLFEAALQEEDGRCVSLLFAPSSRPARPHSDEIRIRHRDGEERWVRVRKALLKGRGALGDRIAGIAEETTAERQARDQLREGRGALCDLATELVLAEEHERRNLANDLHDGLTQTLCMAKLELSHLVHQERDAEGCAHLTAIARGLDQSIDAARSITFQLSPPVLHDFGLISALEWLAEDLDKRFGLDVTINGSHSARHLEERLSAMLFRSVRELLINVAKHARTDRAQVHLEWLGPQLRIEVTDKGRGFLQDSAREHGVGEGFGLASIRRRLEHLGGHFEILSSAGRGTKVIILAPTAIAAPIGTP